MRDRLQWWLILGFCSLILAVLMQGPQWRHMQSPLWKGIAVSLSSDENVYLARVEESLSGRPEQTAEAFTGHPNLVGSQFAMIERFYGTLFRWTGWRAAHVLTFLDAVIPVLLFLSLVFFFQLCGLNQKTALITAIVFCLLQLYNLNRPIHMRSSFLVTLWMMIFLLLALRRAWWWAIPGGIVLGTLVGMYVWSFAFGWAFWGTFFVWELGEWMYGKWEAHKKFAHSRLQRIFHSMKDIVWHFRPRKPSLTFERWHILLLFGCTGVLSAIPFIAKYLILQGHPLFVYGAFRSGMHSGRLPESFIYSGIFLIAVVSAFYVFRKRYEQFRIYRPVFVLLFAIFIYMHQQVVHGITFNFVSHGIFPMAIAALSIVAVAVTTRDKHLAVGAAVLTVYLAALGYDGRYVLQQWSVEDQEFHEQHLAEALPVLDSLPRGRFVSDPRTLAFIAGYTHHDVVYSVYLKNILMTHREIAMRYCLTQLPLLPQERHISETRHLVMPDATSAFGEEVRMQEVALVESACAEADLDPALALETSEVSYIFWNEKRQPTWNLRRFDTNLEEIAAGDGWSLYRIEQ